MPELRRVPLHEIDEPQLAMRATLDDAKLLELQTNIATIGLLQPIGIFAREGRYEIEFGHRRFLAVRNLGWRDIPALVFGDDELQHGAAMVAENTLREDVNAAEEALFYAQLIERRNLDEEKLCALVKRSPDYIGDRMRLLRQDEQVFDALLHDKLNFSVARELNKCEDEAQRRYFLHQAIMAGTGARVVRGWIDGWRATLAPPPAVPAAPDEPSPAPPVEPFKVACELCGGDRDPYNLVNIYVHRWELEEIKKVLRREVSA
jgi:ParB/RepB/Spo0J family partition protein